VDKVADLLNYQQTKEQLTQAGQLVLAEVPYDLHSQELPHTKE
jgi:hypothetical protein